MASAVANPDSNMRIANGTKGDEQRVDHEASTVLAVDRVLPKLVLDQGARLHDDVRASQEAGNQLD